MDIGDFNVVSAGNHVLAICGLDVGSDKPFVFLLQNKSNHHTYVEKLWQLYRNASHKLEVLGVDKAFVTEETIQFCKNRSVEIHQSTPHEHAQLGTAEGLVKILSEDVSKMLYNVRSNYSRYKKMWYLALVEAVSCEASCIKD